MSHLRNVDVLHRDCGRVRRPGVSVVRFAGVGGAVGGAGVEDGQGVVGADDLWGRRGKLKCDRSREDECIFGGKVFLPRKRLEKFTFSSGERRPFSFAVALHAYCLFPKQADVSTAKTSSQKTNDSEQTKGVLKL